MLNPAIKKPAFELISPKRSKRPINTQQIAENAYAVIRLDGMHISLGETKKVVEELASRSIELTIENIRNALKDKKS